MKSLNTLENMLLAQKPLKCSASARDIEVNFEDFSGMLAFLVSFSDVTGIAAHFSVNINCFGTKSDGKIQETENQEARSSN